LAASESLLELGVVVQAEVVLDHVVGNVLGHCAAGDAVLGQVLAGELRAVDAGGELILVAGQLDLREALVEGRFGSEGPGASGRGHLGAGTDRGRPVDCAEMDHDGGCM